MDFLETSDIIWEEVVVDAASARSFHDVIAIMPIYNRIVYERTKAGTLLTLWF